MDNKLKNWADNFRPTPHEEVWTKIVVKKNSKARPKLSQLPNTIIAGIVIIAFCLLIILLNFLHIFKAQKNSPAQKDKIEIGEK